jgi:hypothetical protein
MFGINKKLTGTPALGPSSDKILTRRQLLKLEFKPDIWWKNPIALSNIYACLVSADISSLYNIFNAALIENPFLLWVMVISVSLMFVLVPSILAYTSRKRAPQCNKPPFSHVVLLAAVFIALFLAISFLRFIARNSAMGQTSLATSVGTATGLSQTASDPLTAIAMTMVFCIAIACTAVIAWRIGWELADPLWHKIKELKQQRCENIEKLNELIVTKAEYEASRKAGYSKAEMDRDRFLAALATVQAQRDYLRKYVRVRLMESLKNPAATSMLSIPLDTEPLVKNKTTNITAEEAEA